jgi:hypothetical protein
MGKFGDVAILATKLLHEGKVSSPVEGWEVAVREVFPASASSQEKGCPKCAYLGLCEEGIVIGVPPGKYCGSVKNKGYSLKAVSFLKHTPHKATDAQTLWYQIMRGERKVHNHQMEVVLSLWNEGLLIT